MPLAPQHKSPLPLRFPFREVIPTARELSRVRQLLCADLRGDRRCEPITINDYRTEPVHVALGSITAAHDRRVELPDGTAVTEVSLAGNASARYLVGPPDAMARLLKGETPSANAVSDAITHIRDALAHEVRRVRACLDATEEEHRPVPSRFPSGPRLPGARVDRRDRHTPLVAYRDALQAHQPTLDELLGRANEPHEWWWPWTPAAETLRAEAQDLGTLIAQVVTEQARKLA